MKSVVSVVEGVKDYFHLVFSAHKFYTVGGGGVYKKLVDAAMFLFSFVMCVCFFSNNNKKGGVTGGGKKKSFGTEVEKRKMAFPVGNLKI